MRKHSSKRELILTEAKKQGVFSKKTLGSILESKVDQATIYRNIKLFLEKGLITEIKNGQSERTYEYTGTSKPHHHVICNDCGDIQHIDVDIDLLSKALGGVDLSGKTVDVILK